MMQHPAAPFVAPSADRLRGATSSLPQFDRVARIYRWAEYLTLGPLLRRMREQFLPALGDSTDVLALGDGDGRFTAALLRRVPDCRVHAVDSSAAMLRLLESRCERDGTMTRLALQQASVLEIQASPTCDLIATHFLLDCLSQGDVEELSRRLAGQVAPRCRWVLSEFGVPTGHFLGRVGAAYIQCLYLAFRLLTGLRVQQLPNPQRALQLAGFVRLARVERLRGLLYAELWQLP